MTLGSLTITFHNQPEDRERAYILIMCFQNGVILTTLLAFKYMGKNRGGNGGVVVNNASIAGLGGGMKIFAMYNTSKHAVVGFTRSYGVSHL